MVGRYRTLISNWKANLSRFSTRGRQLSNLERVNCCAGNNFLRVRVTYSRVTHIKLQIGFLPKSRRHVTIHWKIRNFYRASLNSWCPSLGLSQTKPSAISTNDPIGCFRQAFSVILCVWFAFFSEVLSICFSIVALYFLLVTF